MNVNVVSKKLVKPWTPTPQNLRSYQISFIDELVPMPNLCVVLYYESSSSTPHQTLLEQSLSKILPDFYPLAGRYVETERIVDCNDQGALFIVAEASNDVKLLDVISSRQQMEDLLLPRDLGSSDDRTGDPLLAIQVTEFGCGGIAITVNISHRIFDGSCFSTFISHWANATQNMATGSGPIFNASSFFQPKKFEIPEEHSGGTNPEIILRRFRFEREAITGLRTSYSNSTGGTGATRPPSRVVLVSALITRALIRVDRTIQGCSRDFTVSQLVNLRPRTVPPLPENTCGNLIMIASTTPIPADDSEFGGLIGKLRTAVEKTLGDCKEIFGHGETGHAVVVDSWTGFKEAVFGGKVNACWFSDFSKFGFYEADFGWGKPVWAGAGSLDLPNGALLMADKEGGGIEAWVHLNEKSMSVFEQDEEIKLFASK